MILELYSHVYLIRKKFQMENIYSIQNDLVVGKLMIKIHLKDDYLHIPIHLRDRKFLRFAIKMDGMTYHFQYKAFPFWHTFSPRF